MSLQTYFKEFNKKIKLDYDVNSDLANKRDILVGILKNSDDIPSFTVYNQGSYSMHLGVEPLDKEYDIDVGLRFKINKDDYDDPMELKQKIHDILDNHTDYGATIKKPCVTVTYKKDGEAAFHVDLVVYSYEDKDDTDSQLFLARGKKTGADETYWEKSDPVGLINYINEKYKGEEAAKDREQFRRVVRFVKRWKNKQFSSDGNAEPPSIGITLIAVDKFQASKTHDYLEDIDVYDDLNALINFVNDIKNLFVFTGFSSEGRAMYSISYNISNTLGFELNTNVFKKMTNIQMTNFKDKIEALITNLENVKNEADEIEQCKKLSKIFGDDFPVPDKKDASKQQMNYIPSTSSSGAGYDKRKNN